MPRWKKLLARMVRDDSPVGYTYADAVLVLRAMGFTLAPHGSGSHRKWRRKVFDGRTIIIGLVDRGTGPMKAYLVHDMIAQLTLAGLINNHQDDVHGADD